MAVTGDSLRRLIGDTFSFCCSFHDVKHSENAASSQEDQDVAMQVSAFEEVTNEISAFEEVDEAEVQARVKKAEELRRERHRSAA